MPRPYDARRRRERGEASRRQTRRKVLDSARALFLSKGYVASTVKEIAATAGIAEATIYAASWTKREILLAIRDIDLDGNDEPVALLDQDWTRTVANETDPHLQLERLVHRVCAINARAEPIREVMRLGAGGDAQLATDHAEDERRRYVTMAGFLKLLTCWRPRPGLPGEPADVFWTLVSPSTHHHLCCERGWTVGALEQWLRHVLESSLLEHAPSRSLVRTSAADQLLSTGPLASPDGG